MIGVKSREPWATSPHGRALPAPVLLARLMKQMSRVAGEADLDGLRPSHFRLLAELPEDGMRISELAERVGMTKQSCGEFVTALAAGGHVEVRTPADDRRTRLVVRTASGERALERFEALMASLEEHWAARVGTRRYAAFRKVLAELVTG